MLKAMEDSLREENKELRERIEELEKEVERCKTELSKFKESARYQVRFTIEYQP